MRLNADEARLEMYARNESLTPKGTGRKKKEGRRVGKTAQLAKRTH